MAEIEKGFAKTIDLRGHHLAEAVDEQVDRVPRPQVWRAGPSLVDASRRDIENPFLL